MNILFSLFAGPIRLFYQALAKIFGLLEENLPAFSSFKPLYTAAYVSTLKARLIAAKALPGGSGGISKRAVERVKLQSANDLVRLLWQSLKQYVIACYPESERESRLNEIGAAEYAMGYENWGATDQLSEKALPFVEANETALLANDNMPDTFKLEFKDAIKAFGTALTAFNTATNSKVLAKNKKIEENNSLYKTAVTIGKDAAIIFRGKSNAELRRMFTYSYQLAVLRGGFASLRGWLQTEDGTVLEGVKVSCDTEPTWTAVTDAKGYFKMLKLKEGTDRIFRFEKPGFETIELPVTLKAATAKTVKLVMVPLVNA